MNNFNTLKSYSNAFGANLPDFYNGQVRNLDRLVDGKDYFIRSMGVGNPPDSVEITKTFYYGSDGQRVLMVSQEDNVIVSKKYYVGEYEYTVYPSPAPAKEVTFISSPTGLIAANVKIDTTTTFYYVLTDHLGSITQLLKSNGDIVADAQFTYDAWGRLRDVVNYPNAPYTTNAYQQEQFHILDRGYTGHEHLLDHDIINMNGRIYDPVVGQFLQADNYIQTPEDYIGYNRYAYCRYNPFKYTDPSGEFWVGKRGETSVWYDEVEVYGSNPYLTVPLVSGVDYKPASYGNFNYSLLDWFNFPCLKFRSCGTQSLLRVRGTGSSNGSGIDARDETAKYDRPTIADYWWPKMPSDHLNQVSNSIGRRSTYSYNDFRNDAHLMLDAAGLIYDPIDVAHGFWYAWEGNYYDAGMCMLSAVPIIGIPVTAAKWTKKGLKYVDEAGEGIGKSFKLLDAKYLKKIGIDPHSLKKEFLGKKAQIKYYDIFKDTKTNELLIFRKGGKGTPIKTGEFIIK